MSYLSKQGTTTNLGAATKLTAAPEVQCFRMQRFDFLHSFSNWAAVRKISRYLSEHYCKTRLASLATAGLRHYSTASNSPLSWAALPPMLLTTLTP